MARYKITGWASKPTLDHYRHVVVNGAFAESIKQKGLNGPRGIKMLLQHERDKPLGPITTLEQRPEGLWIEAELETDIDYAANVAAAIESIGGLNFSVGFYLLDADIDEDANGREYMVISKGELEEISVVTFPGNADATMTRSAATEPVDKALATLAKLRLTLQTTKQDHVRQSFSKQLDEMKRIFK